MSGGTPKVLRRRRLRALLLDCGGEFDLIDTSEDTIDEIS